MKRSSPSPKFRIPLAVSDELSGHVIDRRDVIGVHRVPQPECERQQPGAHDARVAAGQDGMQGGGCVNVV